MNDTKLKIKRTLERISEDDSIPSGHRDALTDMLSAAEIAANGTDDKVGAIADAVGAMAVFLARREDYETERIEARVKSHTDACPFRAAGATGRAAAWYPYRWPLALVVAVALLSPYAGPALGRLIDKHSNQVVEQAIHNVQE